MTDVHDRAARSRNMAAIKSKNTKPELIVRKAIHRAGFRFRLHAKLPGRPDLVFPKYRIALFIHGCFWHRHACKNGQVVPNSRREFWMKKLSDNVARDIRNRDLLKKDGWTVLTLWECEVCQQSVQSILDRIKVGASNPSLHQSFQ